jgi:hypothetical protein
MVPKWFSVNRNPNEKLQLAGGGTFEGWRFLFLSHGASILVGGYPHPMHFGDNRVEAEI